VVGVGPALADPLEDHRNRIGTESGRDVLRGAVRR
jgi:hypothetical protein